MDDDDKLREDTWDGLLAVTKLWLLLSGQSFQQMTDSLQIALSADDAI